MRALLPIFILVCSGIYSCTKNKSNPASPHAGLLKTIVDSLPGNPGQQGVSHFSYDEQNRLTTFEDSTYNNSIFRAYDKYTFNYEGDSMIPTGYAMLQTDNFGQTIIQTHLLTYNAQGKIAMDSLLPGSHSLGNIYYEYSAGVAIHIQAYYPDNTPEQYVAEIDSNFIDNSGNIISVLQIINTTGPPTNIFTDPTRIKSTYGTVKSPFYNTPATILYTIRNGFPSQYYPLVTDVYGQGSQIITSSHQYHQELNPNSVLGQNTDLTDSSVTHFYYF